MPIYRYLCRVCGDAYEPYCEPDSGHKAAYDSGYMDCHTVDCHGTYRRKFSFARHADPVGDGYYDHSVGEFISSKRQLDEINKHNSEAATKRTGVEHNFVAQDIRDPAFRPPELDEA